MRSFETMKQEIDAHYPLYINGEWVEGEGGRMDVGMPRQRRKAVRRFRRLFRRRGPGRAGRARGVSRMGGACRCRAAMMR